MNIHDMNCNSLASYLLKCIKHTENMSVLELLMSIEYDS